MPAKAGAVGVCAVSNDCPLKEQDPVGPGTRHPHPPTVGQLPIKTSVDCRAV